MVGEAEGSECVEMGPEANGDAGKDGGIRTAEEDGRLSGTGPECGARMAGVFGGTGCFGRVSELLAVPGKRVRNPVDNSVDNLFKSCL